MKAYRYFAPAAHAPTPPDADTIMDELAGHVLERDSLEDAMQRLSKEGIEQAYGDSLDGLDKLASDLQGRRRDLLDEYSMDPLLERLSEKLQSLVKRETEALRDHFSAEQDKLDKEAESFLEKADSIVKKLEKLEARAKDEDGDSPHGTSRIENTFEKLFLAKHEMQAQSRALREEEASRMAALKKVSGSPAEALKELKDYQPVDQSIADDLSALSEMADEIGAIERVHAQPGFSGDTEVDLPDAAGVVKQVLGMERLGSKLRKGNLSEADELRLAETLGPEALAGVEMIANLKNKLLAAGYIEETDGETRLSPRGIRRIGQKALADVFSQLSAGRPGGHATILKGLGEPDVFETKAYAFGDPLNIHLGGTLMNAVARCAGSVPLKIAPGDFEVYAERRSSDCSTVLLLDLSHTMSRDGKLPAAKKVALALDSLIRTRFPRDTLHIVGFATYARELSPEEIPHVGIDPGSPFTNMQDALRLAEELISRDRGRNRQALLITDGEPSAYCNDGELRVDYPPTEEIFEATLKEAARLTRKGIDINTFMLDARPSLIQFVERLAALNKGRAFFTTPNNLGEYLLVDYLARRRKTIT
jgi:uncharacterized protein with von Willebrand factor type A (vWA) domain